MNGLSAKARACLLCLFLAFPAATATHAAPVSLHIDAGKRIGPVPDLLTSSIWIQQINETERYVYDRFFAENRPAAVHLSLPILARTKDAADARAVIRAYLSSPAATALITDIRNSDALLIIGFDPCPMPAWLSSRAGDRRSITGMGSFDDWATMESCSPPRDYALWAEVVAGTLRYFKKDLGIRKLGYYVGHEQELQWAGSEQDFFTYYEKTAEAVKSAGRELLVGGPGPAIWNKSKYGCEHLNPEIQGVCRQQGGWKEPGNEPFLKNFIDYVGRKKLPLDFVNLHSFGASPRSFLTAVPVVKGWLASRGLKDTPVYVSDWTAWNGPYPNGSLDTEETAAYIPQALYYMWKAGVAWHGHDFNVRNSQLEKGDGAATFTGDWPIFTKDHIFKPSYNALRALTLFGGARSRSSLLDAQGAEGSAIVALASRQENDRVAVLIDYFAPDISSVMFRSSYLLDLLKQQNMFRNVEREIDAAVDCMKNDSGDRSGKDRGKFCMGSVSAGLDPERKLSLETAFRIYGAFTSPRPLDQLRTVHDQTSDSGMKKKISDLDGVIRDLSRTETVEIQVANLPFAGKATISTYTIDEDHANPCTANRRTGSEGGRTTRCGAGGVIDKQVAEAKLAALREGAEALKKDLDRSGSDERKTAVQKAFIDRCLSSGTYAESIRCLKAKVGDNRELKNRLKKGLDVFAADYAKRAQGVNDLADSALTPVRKAADIAGGRSLSTEMRLKPNSVVLLVIEKAGR